MKSTRGIHWVTPVTMVASLVAGCLLSLGHHLFYMHLTGTDAPTGRYSIAGTEVSKQKFNTAVGTAFAFLVKSMLTLAIAIAYVQAFWRTIKVSEKGQRLSTLDTTFSILGNALNFVKLHIWIKFPLLFLLAVIAWSVVTQLTGWHPQTEQDLGRYRLLLSSRLLRCPCRVSCPSHLQ